MTAEIILAAVRETGGQIWIEAEKLKYRLPAERTDLIQAMQKLKGELLNLLSQRPAMPAGVRLVKYAPKPAPVQLSQCSTITNVDRFVETTLRQLDARLSGKSWLAGNWSLSTLLERLAAVGVDVVLDDPSQALQ